MHANEVFHSSVNTQERIDAVREMDYETLARALHCDGVQNSVLKAIESRMRKLLPKLLRTRFK